MEREDGKANEKENKRTMKKKDVDFFYVFKTKVKDVGDDKIEKTVGDESKRSAKKAK